MTQHDLFNYTPEEEEVDAPDLIECVTCHEAKPTSAYNLYDSVPQNGTRRMCKPCFNEYSHILRQLKRENRYPANPVCECCGRHADVAGKLQLDHDHLTHKFRGWLCRSCNASIGGLGDDIPGVERGLAYLRKVYGVD